MKDNETEKQETHSGIADEQKTLEDIQNIRDAKQQSNIKRVFDTTFFPSGTLKDGYDITLPTDRCYDAASMSLEEISEIAGARIADAWIELPHGSLEKMHYDSEASNIASFDEDVLEEMREISEEQYDQAVSRIEQFEQQLSATSIDIEMANGTHQFHPERLQAIREKIGWEARKELDEAVKVIQEYEIEQEKELDAFVKKWTLKLAERDDHVKDNSEDLER